MATKDHRKLPFAAHLWQCAQTPTDKRGMFAPGWSPKLFESFSPGWPFVKVRVRAQARSQLHAPVVEGDTLAVDNHSNQRHCHALVLQCTFEAGQGQDSFQAPSMNTVWYL